MPLPKLAILDDYQNISPAHFSRLLDRIEIAYFPETLDPRDPAQQESLIQRLHPYNVILAMRERTPFSADTLSRLPNLKLLLTTGMRNASLDTKYCAERGIPVAGTLSRPKGAHSTVQHTWALILSLARHIARDDAALKRGEYWQGSLGMTLAGKTLGLVGLGKLGAQVGRIATEAFGMDVIAWSANLTQERADEQAEKLGLEKGSFVVVQDKMEFFGRADVVSLHLVLSERSRGVVGGDELAAMKSGSLLVNTSRGPLIDEAALLETLNAGRITGAALDVFDAEPLPRESPWRTTPWGIDGRSEVVLTPHMGYGDEQIHGCQKAFASGAISLISLAPGSLFTKITTATPSKKAYTSVQTGRDTHIELNSDLVFCNHSCTPSLNFDMAKMEVRVVDDRPLKAGDALTFFYPSSEWEMDQKFQCNCGAGGCRGWISGAGQMEREQLQGYWLNPHIEELLREKEGQ
ncbi:D-isomer specific 2-hydroxyacid dehydrogenase [Aspergillus californicus]